MDMMTSTRQVGDVTVVDITGRISLGEESAALRELIMNLLSEGHQKILMNLAGVSYIDSSGLGALVSGFTSVRKAGGELKLVNLTDKVDNLMEVTKLYTVFDIATDEAAGVKSFDHKAAAGARKAVARSSGEWLVASGEIREIRQRNRGARSPGTLRVLG